jgi:hypothetical protein
MIKGQRKFEQKMVSKYGAIFQPNDGWQKLAADVFIDYGLIALIRETLSELKGQEDIFNLAEQAIRGKIQIGQGLPYWSGQVEALKAYFSNLSKTAQRVLPAIYGLDGEEVKSIAEISQRERLKETLILGIQVGALKYFRRRRTRLSIKNFITWADITAELNRLNEECVALRREIDAQNRQVYDLQREKLKLDEVKQCFVRLGFIVNEPEPSDDQSLKHQVEDRILDFRIDDLDFCVRTYNCLKRQGWETVRDIISHPDVLNENHFFIRNFGHKSHTEVKKMLKMLGLALPELPCSDSDDED